MTLNIEVDDELVEEAKSVGSLQSDVEAVTAALKEYILRHRQQQVVELFGMVDYEPDYDYKAQRSRE